MDNITKNAKETQKIAIGLVGDLAGKKTKGALVLGLVGELGAGKTTFIQGMAEALKIKERILSPTFVIMKRFIIHSPRFANFYHIDCYRIENPKELITLGFKKIISEPKNLVVIEWAEKIKEVLPEDTVWLKFEHLGKDRRRIKLLNFKI